MFLWGVVRGYFTYKKFYKLNHKFSNYFSYSLANCTDTNRNDHQKNQNQNCKRDSPCHTHSRTASTLQILERGDRDTVFLILGIA